MIGYVISATEDSPSVIFNPKKGILDIRGVSDITNAFGFYSPIYKVLEKFENSDATLINVNLAFKFLSTSSLVYVHLLIKKLVSLRNNKERLNINWYYEIGNKGIKYDGEDLSQIYDHPFQFHQISKIRELKNFDKQENVVTV